MTRSGSLVIGAVCALLAFGPTLAYAQDYPPPPPPQYQQPPPPGYPPPGYPPPGYPPPPPEGYPPPPPPGYPPPQYYQPPPPQYYAPPPPPERTPSNGVGLMITGAIMLPLGIILLGTSVILWNDSGRCALNTPTTFGGCSNGADVAGAVTMDVFGSAMVVMGAIFLPVGIVQMSKYGRWKKTHSMAFDLGHGWSVTPSLTAGASSGRAGLSFQF